MRPMVLLLLLVSLTAAGPAPERAVIMVEDAAPPWSKADGTGYANDVVVAAFAAANVLVTLDVVPYARCKKAVLAGETPACFSMSWLPEFDGKIKLASIPLIRLSADVFVPADRPLPQGPAVPCKLPKGTALGLVREYEYPPETNALVASGMQVTLSSSDRQSLKMLANDRLDAAVVVTNDLEPKNAKALEAGVADKVRFAFNCGQETGTVGFSLLHPRGPRLRARFEAGYAKIAADGTLKKLSARWER